MIQQEVIFEKHAQEMRLEAARRMDGFEDRVRGQLTDLHEMQKSLKAGMDSLRSTRVEQAESLQGLQSDVERNSADLVRLANESAGQAGAVLSTRILSAVAISVSSVSLVLAFAFRYLF